MNYKPAPKGGPLDGQARITMGYARSGSKRVREELKVEFPEGTLRIVTGLRNEKGLEVVSIGVSANGTRYAGERPVWARTVKDKTGASMLLTRARASRRED